MSSVDNQPHASDAIDHKAERSPPSRLVLRRLGVDTYQEHIVYMRADCHVCRSEGFEARSRVRVSTGGKSLLATLNVIKSELLGLDEASLSEAAWVLLAARDGDVIEVTHAEPVESERFVRAKAYGERLPDRALSAIVNDIANGLYSDLHLAAFVTACAGNRLDLDETIGLTRAMIAVGDRISWPYPIVADKHCVGGLPGNRTTMLVVPIVAALGLPIPKTSSRSITSPAGTADTMETLAPVNLDLATMRRVVEREGGCIVWGGNARLSPADDILIRVERPLDFDSEGQLVASVLSKKLAAGATHAVFDLPVGPTAKVRSREAAKRLGERLSKVGAILGLNARILETDGSQPVGRGIGPALEARDVLAVIQQDASGPTDLRDRALHLAGHLLELGGRARQGEGARLAAEALETGIAWEKFQAICEAQGGMRAPPRAEQLHPVVASSGGRVATMDNRRLAKVAKLAGAPKSPAAGIDLHVRLEDRVEAGQPLFTVHAQSRGELAYALNYVAAQRMIIGIVE
ncbi:MAG: thymidine phosphorylase family protein [Hyphomicrobium sp.]|uniref:thymidine phosphorylase family protein n=1 Tax=Hyphomicrobium sp. TaxID=82 RepID=UPI001327B20A|nr:thymidine phosphorylase family protein [Hyphomicrobium sp.]KAB2943093.1 MAG: thymidine phosphorylase family protein [Hyphomicrobium sp.]MBZ0208970.1 thymidine phosphorylase family protein [Hyphomicrobium sp.]